MISAADGRGTLFDMLADAEPPRRVEKMDDGSLPMHSQVQVPLGVKRDLSAEPHWVTHLLDEPVLLTRETLPMMLMGVPRTLPGLKDFYMAGGSGGAGRQRAARGCIRAKRHPDDLPRRR